MLVLPGDPSLADRLAVFREHWRRGARYRIPLCCRAHFCLDSALGRIVSVVRWRQIGAWQTALHSTDPWVPCGFLHRGYSPYGLLGRAARILAFQATVRLPGERSRWMRARMTTPGPMWTTVTPTVKCAISRAGGNGQLWWSRNTAGSDARRQRRPAWPGQIVGGEPGHEPGRHEPQPPVPEQVPISPRDVKVPRIQEAKALGRPRGTSTVSGSLTPTHQPRPCCGMARCFESRSDERRIDAIPGDAGDRRVAAGSQDLERRSSIESRHAAV